MDKQTCGVTQNKPLMSDEMAFVLIPPIMAILITLFGLSDFIDGCLNLWRTISGKKANGT